MVHSDLLVRPKTEVFEDDVVVVDPSASNLDPADLEDTEALIAKSDSILDQLCHQLKNRKKVKMIDKKCVVKKRGPGRPKGKVKPKAKPSVEKFSCDICYRIFREKVLLKDHRKKYHGLGGNDGDGNGDKTDDMWTASNALPCKPFKCPECKKVFRWKGNLKKHMLVHDGQPLVTCVSGPEFNDVDKLKLRKMIIGQLEMDPGTREYRCGECGFSSKTRLAVFNHVKAKHFKIPTASTRKVLQQQERS